MDFGRDKHVTGGNIHDFFLQGLALVRRRCESWCGRTIRVRLLTRLGYADNRAISPRPIASRGTVRYHGGMDLQATRDLPIHDVLDTLRLRLDEGDQAVLQAPPGAGKTTVVPLALLEEDWLGGRKILVLEPRRVATRAAAISRCAFRVAGSLNGLACVIARVAAVRPGWFLLPPPPPSAPR